MRPRRIIITMVVGIMMLWCGLVSAATLFFSEDYETGLDGWDLEQGVTTSTTRAHSGSYAMRADTSQFSIAMKHNIHTSRRAYLSFWEFWPSSTSLGPDSAAHWFRFYSPSWTCVMDFVTRARDGNPMLTTYFTIYGSGGCEGGQGDYEIQFDSHPARNDTWHHVEVFYENDPVGSTGWMQVWYDGVVIADITSLQDGSVPHFGATLSLFSNIGGTGYVYADDVEMWDSCPTTLKFGGTPSCQDAPEDKTAPSPPTNLTVVLGGN